jgi:IS5 family transposase
LADRVPDARTIWLFREKLTTAGAIKRLFEQFDAMLRQAGYIAMSGQIVDASLVAAPRQRNTDDEKKGNQAGPDTGELEGQAGQAVAQRSRRALDGQIQQGQTARGWFNAASQSGNPAIWLSEPCLDRSPFRLHPPMGGHRCAAYEGRRLRQGLLDKSSTASGVWADTAYRSAANQTFLTKNGFVSHIHRKKPKGRAMPETMRRANNAKSKIRSRVEHVFAEQKDQMGLFIRTIGIARATTKIGMANLVYNIKRLIFLRKIAIA